MDRNETCQAGDLHWNFGLDRSHLIGFMEKMLYTASNILGDIGVRSERQYHGHATTQPNLRQ
jgi:hypothetical protein